MVVEESSATISEVGGTSNSISPNSSSSSSSEPSKSEAKTITNTETRTKDLSAPAPAPYKYRSMIPDSCTIPPTLLPPKGLIASSSSNAAAPGEQGREKDDQARIDWCRAYDAAQPTGNSLSTKDAQFQEILKAFREAQLKKVQKVEPVAVSDGESARAAKESLVKEKEKQTFKKWISSRF